ncbi:MAG: class I SAM-dependent methyltransferase [Thermodesulfobacteriota bacterium]
MNLTSENKFNELIRTIRKRSRESFSGYWFNLIKFRGHHFIQGNIADAASECGINRNIATLVDEIKPDDIKGTWPQIIGYPVEESEEDFLVHYLSVQGEGDIELIIPERNIARSVSWRRFDSAGEFKIYETFIYPAIVEALKYITFHTFLDVGCGSGNLIEIITNRFPNVRYCGIDSNRKNIDAAKEKRLSNIFLGDCERIDEILPDNRFFDMILFCGLLNVQVTTKEKAGKILNATIPRLKRGGHIIITGYSPCHFTAEDLAKKGIQVLRKSIPTNIFKDYLGYYVRQLYLGRKE